MDFYYMFIYQNPNFYLLGVTYKYKKSVIIVIQSINIY